MSSLTPQEWTKLAKVFGAVIFLIILVLLIFVAVK